MGLTEKFQRKKEAHITVCDHRDQEIAFDVFTNKTSTGWIAVAEETPESRGERIGYVLTAYSGDNLETAVAILKDKVRRELSIKYIEEEGDKIRLTQPHTPFRISYCKDLDAIVLEVNGRRVTRDQLFDLLKDYEGWELDCRIVFPDS